MERPTVAEKGEMRILVAGSTGAIGRSLLPLLLSEGHEVVGLARSPDRAGEVERLGARAVVADPLDAEALTAAVLGTAPEVIIHQLTALKEAGDFRRFDQEFALTNRFRTEVTDVLLGAARLAGTRRFIAQSFCGWPFARDGGPVKTEEDPLDPHPPAGVRKTLAAIRHLENAVREATDLEALAVRYGMLYGAGTAIAEDGSIVRLLRERKIPIVGSGAGVWSFVHLDDAARATAIAVSRGEPGIYNIVDDEPAAVLSWLPELARQVGAPPPRKIPTWLAWLAIGSTGVSMMTKIRGGSNEKAKRELGWEPRYGTWRRGFAEGLR